MTKSTALAKAGMHKCDDCGRLFDTPQGLAGHRLSHQDVPPCDECGQKFTTPSARARHRNKHHGVPLKGAQVKRSKAAQATNGWDADDILDGLVASLWPGGLVPVTAISPLFRWRVATHELLAAVQSPPQTQT